MFTHTWSVCQPLRRGCCQDSSWHRRSTSGGRGCLCIRLRSGTCGATDYSAASPSEIHSSDSLHRDNIFTIKIRIRIILMNWTHIRGFASNRIRKSGSASGSASNKNQGPDPHQSDKLDPEADLNPHQFADAKPKSRNMSIFEHFFRVWAFTWKLGLDPDPHLDEKSDKGPHQIKIRIRIK